MTDRKTETEAKSNRPEGVEATEKKQKRRSLSPAANLLAAGAVLCFIIGGYALFHSRTAGNYHDLQSKADSASTAVTAAEAGATAANAANTSDTGASSTAAAAVPAEEIPINFEEIQQDAPDIYAWIRIPETQIDYPVCQSPEDKDQDFYLSHRPDGTEEFAGSIYSQNYNSKDFTDPVTVLYGHDMANGSMFQNLHLYEDEDFFDKNREVILYLPDKVLHYRVVAAYNTDDGHILLNNDCFENPEVYDLYLRDLRSRTYVISGIVDDEAASHLNRQSRLLILSTCNNVEDQRFIVTCVLEQ
ncbi:MAG: class B sortase [Eubacteriales bacterium]|nr:class B sortase [Eubacteriales bacterium]